MPRHLSLCLYILAVTTANSHRLEAELTCRLNAKTATASKDTGSKLSKPMMRSHNRSTSPTARWPAKAVMIQGRARCNGGHPRPLRCCATSASLSCTPEQFWELKCNRAHWAMCTLLARHEENVWSSVQEWDIDNHLVMDKQA